MRAPFLFFVVFIFSIKLLAQATIPNNYKLIYAQDFELPQALNDFEMTDALVWKITKENNGHVLELTSQSKYEPLVRSPFNIAMIKNVIVGDFILEVKLNQNGREYNHRDLCLMFGINNATNFYYTHIATKPDDHAHSIFIVNDEPRISIASKRTNGVNWGEADSWHTARVVRKVKEGIIEIYFDDMTQPIIQAKDTRFVSGKIGVGSFDDTGKFDDIKIWAPQVLKEKNGVFN